MKDLMVRTHTFTMLTSRLAAILAFAALLFAVPFHAALAATAPDLGSAGNFAVLAGSAVTCTDSVVLGDVGVAGVAFTPTNCTVSGTVHVGDAVAQAAYADFLAAYTKLATVPACTSSTSLTSLGTTSFVPGVYCFDAAVTETSSTWTLDGACDATWIFRIGTLGTGAFTGTSFTVVHPGCPVCPDNNVFWWTAQAATLTDSVFIGSILAGADITATRTGLGSSLAGRALAGGTGTTAVPTGEVTLTGPGTSVCGPLPPIKFHGSVTGGGQIPVPNPDSNGRATFGFNAKGNEDGTATGHFNYLNHVTGLHVNGPVDDVVVTVTNPDGSPKTVRFSGTCSNLPACSFSVTVEDNGEPGKIDEFGITVTGGLTEARSQRVISNGNIQFHK